MVTEDNTLTSIAARVAEHWSRQELVYTRDPDGQAFWPPSDVSPLTGADAVWEVSSGEGILYSLTVQYPRGEAPNYLGLVDLDEGFRMLAKVTAAAGELAIGDRVVARWETGEESGFDSVPLFFRVEGSAS